MAYTSPYAPFGSYTDDAGNIVTSSGQIWKKAAGSSDSLAGSSSSRGSEAYGYVPTVPDPTSTTEKAISGNLSNLGSVENLASQINNFQQQQLLNQITSLYPQFTSTTSQLGSNIADWASGKISQSTVNQLAQNAAQRGAAGGMDVTSPNANAALMAVLGKTSEGLQNQALTGYSTLMKAIPTVTPTSLTDWMVTPSQQYNAQLLSNIYSSAANPATAAEQSLKNVQKGLGVGYYSTGAGRSSGSSAGTTGSGTSDLLSSLIDRVSGAGSSASSASTGTGTGTLTMDPWSDVSAVENLWDETLGQYTPTTSNDTWSAWEDEMFGNGSTGTSDNYNFDLGTTFEDWAYGG